MTTKSAELISQKLGTEHNELKVSYENIFDTIIQIPQIYSEPFALAASQIPTIFNI